MYNNVQKKIQVQKIATTYKQTNKNVQQRTKNKQKSEATHKHVNKRTNKYKKTKKRYTSRL